MVRCSKISVRSSFRLKGLVLQIVMKNAARLFSCEVSPQTLAMRQLGIEIINTGKRVPDL